MVGYHLEAQLRLHVVEKVGELYSAAVEAVGLSFHLGYELDVVISSEMGAIYRAVLRKVAAAIQCIHQVLYRAEASCDRSRRRPPIDRVFTGLQLLEFRTAGRDLQRINRRIPG